MKNERLLSYLALGGLIAADIKLCRDLFRVTRAVTDELLRRRRLRREAGG